MILAFYDYGNGSGGGFPGELLVILTVIFGAIITIAWLTWIFSRQEQA